MRFNRCVCTLLFGFLILVGYAEAAEGPSVLENELTKLIDNYKNRSVKVKETIRYIKWTGISDTRFFNLVEEDLKSVSLNELSSKKLEDIGWQIQALAYSGNEKYKPSIERFLKAKSNKLRRNAKSSLKVLPKFSDWNLIISASLSGLDESKLLQQRVMNMLNSDDYNLIRSGASRVHEYHISDASLVAKVATRLKEKYPLVIAKFPDADAVAWLCKVLGETGDAQYLPLLEEVRDNAKADTVKKWAKKAIDKIR